MSTPFLKSGSLPQARIIKKSVMIAGHRTAVSLERCFWDQAKRLCIEHDISMNQFISHVDQLRLELQPDANLSSALRAYLLAVVTTEEPAPILA